MTKIQYIEELEQIIVERENSISRLNYEKKSHNEGANSK